MLKGDLQHLKLTIQRKLEILKNLSFRLQLLVNQSWNALRHLSVPVCPFRPSRPTAISREWEPYERIRPLVLGLTEGKENENQRPLWSTTHDWTGLTSRVIPSGSCKTGNRPGFKIVLLFACSLAFSLSIWSTSIFVWFTLCCFIGRHVGSTTIHALVQNYHKPQKFFVVSLQRFYVFKNHLWIDPTTHIPSPER